MSEVEIIRAWKDKDYRNSLTEEQKEQLPENPAGLIELTDDDMSSMAGGAMHTSCPVHCVALARS